MMAYATHAHIFMAMGSNPLHHSDYEVFVGLLKCVREEAGITQLDLAHRLGMDQSTISKIERRERRVDVAELRRICIALGISLATFAARLECALSGREEIV